MLSHNETFHHRSCENTELYYSHACMNDFLCCDSCINIILLYIPVTPIISVNCSSVTTVNESDYFACECKGTDGNPPADVTWYKNNRNVSDTGKEKEILRFTNISKDDSGTYRCEAKSHEEGKNETFMELIVNCE